MADGFIVRKGGVAAEQTATPSILDFSTESPTSIKFKLRNNDSVAATLVYRFGTLTGDGESISVAANTTTSEITLTVPSFSVATTLFVTANATGKVKSEVAEQEFPAPIIYTAATGGTTAEYDSSGKRYKSHTFNSSGTFEVTTAGNGDRNEVDYLIIAGGGGGGFGGGGAGAGGYRTTVGDQGGLGTLDTKVVVTAQSYTITIGAGGAGGTSAAGSNGVNSSALNITSTSGGGGGGVGEETGKNGGSGGGAGRIDAARSGGSGTTNQGFGGGNNVNGGIFPSGGGGGAGVVGQTAPSGSVSGAGGNGLANLLRTGSNETRAGGGGGGGRGASGGAGGSGGGGTGGDGAGTSGTTNTGSGGGGGGQNASTFAGFNGGAGGSGLVVIRYEIAPSV